MDEALGLREALGDIFTQLSQYVVELVPRLITALVVVLIGWIIAKIVQKVLRSSLRRVKFDGLLERVGIAEMLQGIGLRGSPTDGLARLLYYLLLILFVQGAATAVGLAAVTDAIGSFFGYLPRIVAALLIILLGNVVGRFASAAVEESGRESGLDYAAALGRAVSGGILFIVAIMAIAQLGIDTAMIRTIVIVALSGSAVAFALSFGLGTRDITRNIMAGFYSRKIFTVGESIEIRGERGTLVGITATQTLLDQDGKTVSIANSAFLDEVVRQ